MTTYQAFELTVDDGLARITFNQPETGNTMNEEFCREFGEIGNELTLRDDIRAVLISARGKYFSCGGDIKVFSENLDDLPKNILSSVTGLHIGISRLMRLDAPLIASVQGTAMGGAVAILSNCDYVLSARSSSFGAAYHHLAFPCDLGGTTGLASRMGPARARRFLILGEVLDAEEAANVGLVDEVTMDEELTGRAEALARKLSNGPTRTYGMVRRLISTALAQPFEAQLEDEVQTLIEASGSEDATEGVKAFLEKRPPKFVGR